MSFNASDIFRQVAEVPEQAIMPRSNRNPYDKSTIVSIFPLPIEEYKFTIQPSRFTIKPGTFEKPSLTVVGASSWWQPMDNRPPLEIICSSVEVAGAVIADYCRGLLGCDMDGKTPGMFFVPKEVRPKELLPEFKEDLEKAKSRQLNWYRELVYLADALWSRAQNPIFIWEVMRLAARELNLHTKPWLVTDMAVEKVKCFACGSLKDPKFPVCPNCRIPDPAHPLTKDLPRSV